MKIAIGIIDTLLSLLKQGRIPSSWKTNWEEVNQITTKRASYVKMEKRTWIISW